MKDCYAANTLAGFWGLDPEAWPAANKAVSTLPGEMGAIAQDGWSSLMAYTLGEGQFGPAHWHLSLTKRLYYAVRAFLPRQIRPILRRALHAEQKRRSLLGWPVEDRYVRFLYAVLEAVQKQHPDVCPRPFWPSGARFAFVLTHDVETAAGQAFVRQLADIEERYGFRSSFNLVPEGYPVDQPLLAELRERGFEIGVHGLKHDGRLFSSRAEFERRAKRINRYLREWGAVGFRSPFTHRNPEWMQSLEIEYDSSFFDTDPYETIPGGTMSIWPFFCGRFVELPYTLAQDHTLFETLGQHTPQIWLEKVDFIARWGGMALVDAHPDYLRNPARLQIYESFLSDMAIRQQKTEGECWHALPRDVARWWRMRSETISSMFSAGVAQAGG